jgi:putative hemolysin
MVSYFSMNLTISSMPNPAAEYCFNSGYTYGIRETEDGGQIGMCQFPDGTNISAWSFLRGGEKQEMNYCNQKGYNYTVLENSSSCPGYYFGSCVACILPGGSLIEAGELARDKPIPTIPVIKQNVEPIANGTGNEEINNSNEAVYQGYIYMLLAAFLIIFLALYLRRPRKGSRNR